MLGLDKAAVVFQRINEWGINLQERRVVRAKYLRRTYSGIADSSKLGRL